MTALQNFSVIDGGRSTSPVDRRGRAAAAGALILLGVGLARVAGRRRRQRREAATMARHSELGDYLREHLSGSDAAIHVVDRLRHAHDRADERVLFARLFEEFQEERQVVRALVTQLGESPFSVKRIAGKVTGSIVETIVRTHDDDLSLFRALEALSIGVQGKRCLWRSLQSLDSAAARAGLSQLRRAGVDGSAAVGGNRAAPPRPRGGNLHVEPSPRRGLSRAGRAS